MRHALNFNITRTATLLVFATSLPAFAKVSFPNYIPNGATNSCSTCHVSPYGVVHVLTLATMSAQPYRVAFLTGQLFTTLTPMVTAKPMDKS